MKSSKLACSKPFTDFLPIDVRRKRGKLSIPAPCVKKHKRPILLKNSVLVRKMATLQNVFPRHGHSGSAVYNCITFVNQHGEADTIRDFLAAKVNTDHFSRWDGASNRTISLGVE